MAAKMNVGIYIYDQAEVLDFSGPFEVFTTAGRVSGNPDLFNVFLVAEKADTILARGGFRVLPHYGFSNHPGIDLLIIAGGVHVAEMQKQPVIQWLKAQSEQVPQLASVCTGVFLLAEAGVLSSQKVTTHWQDIPSLRQRYPKLDVLENQRWVDEGEVVTSGGISAGIDMSLHLVHKFHGIDLAEKTARQMEFEWTQTTL